MALERERGENSPEYPGASGYRRKSGWNKVGKLVRSRPIPPLESFFLFDLLPEFLAFEQGREIGYSRSTIFFHPEVRARCTQFANTSPRRKRSNSTSDFREKERERDCVPKEFSFRFNELIKSIKTSFISAIFDGRNVHVKGTSYSRRSRGISKLCRQNLRMTHRFMRWL